MKQEEIIVNVREPQSIEENYDNTNQLKRRREPPKRSSRNSDNQGDGSNNGQKKPKRKLRPWMIIIGSLLILVLICFILTYNSIINGKDDIVVNLDIPPEQGITIEIPRGSSTGDIAKLLEKEGVITHPTIYKIISKLNGFDSLYQSGVHIIPKDSSRNNIFKIVSKYQEIMKILSSSPRSVKITFKEGMTLKEVAQKLYDKKVVNIDEFINATQKNKFNYKFLTGIPDRETKMQGYLFPDTYEFGMKEKVNEVIEKMLDNFNNKFKPEYYEQAKKLNMSVDQIITLASIIEQESSKADERKIIAGVFYNRMKSKDPTLRKLQSCASVQYILKSNGVSREVLTLQDTKINNPYNTYLHEGLPPGPICSPSLDAIQAALYPEKTDYMYFVARGDGTNQFSKTYKEHEAAMKKYGLLK